MVSNTPKKTESILELLDFVETLSNTAKVKRHYQYSNLVDLTNFLSIEATALQRLWHIKNNTYNIPKCTVCNTNNAIWNRAKGGSYRPTCSAKCSAIDPQRLRNIKTTNIKKYGSASPFGNIEVQQKSKKTVLQRYNVDNVSLLSSVQEKKQQTSLVNWGTIHPVQNTEVRNKINDTNNIKYGHTNYLASDIGRAHTERTMMEKYGVPHTNQKNIQSALRLLNDKNWLIEQHHTLKKTLIQIGMELGVLGDTVSKYIHQHNITVKSYFQSTGEQEVGEFIRALDVDIITNSRSIVSTELDIFIPMHNIAIEYNGLYWHSEVAGKDSRYHYNKTKLCEEKGIRLLHIFEDEWKFQQQQCKDTIRHLLGKSCKGIYARKVNITEISWMQAKQFLTKYHLLGSGSAGTHRIGAFDDDNDLVGVMVFGNKNNENSNTDEIELKRFVTNKKNNPGLGSKMFKWAVTKYNYTKIIAFVDRRWFTGLVKSHIGFKVHSETIPAVWWTNGKVRKHRRAFSKAKLLKDFQVLNEDMSKREMLKSIGFYRIWDCGKIKLVWNK